MNGPLAALLALSLTATAGPRGGDAPWLSDAAPTGRVSTAAATAEDPAAAVAQARAELAEIRSLLDTASTHRDKRRIAIRLARLDQTLATADNAIAQRARAAWGRGDRPAPTMPTSRARVHDDDDDDDGDDEWRHRRSQKPSPRAMSSAAFASFQAQIDRAAFASERMQLIESAAHHRHFTAAQVGQLIDGLPFGAEKVQAGVMLYPRTLDKGNWHVVYDGFDFRVDARNLARQVAAM